MTLSTYALLLVPLILCVSEFLFSVYLGFWKTLLCVGWERRKLKWKEEWFVLCPRKYFWALSFVRFSSYYLFWNNINLVTFVVSQMVSTGNIWPIASIWHNKYVRIFVRKHYLFRDANSFRERSSRKTLNFDLSKDKYTSMFSRQMETVIFTILEKFL